MQVPAVVYRCSFNGRQISNASACPGRVFHLRIPTKAAIFLRIAHPALEFSVFQMQAGVSVRLHQISHPASVPLRLREAPSTRTTAHSKASFQVPFFLAPNFTPYHCPEQLPGTRASSQPSRNALVASLWPLCLGINQGLIKS